MAMPNRSKEVKAICAKYPQTFGPPDNTLDARRRLLIPIVVRELNKLDNDMWCVLNRLDRNDDDPKPGRLTSDVIVWFPTKEHVDVLSAKGGMWNEHPPITDRDWILEHPDNWPSWDDSTQPTNPPIVPTPVPDEDTILDVSFDLIAENQVKQIDLMTAQLDTLAAMSALLEQLRTDLVGAVKQLGVDVKSGVKVRF